MERFNFSPAADDETIVFGACRPGYYLDSNTQRAIEQWLEHMTDAGIDRVLCLLDEKLDTYEVNLLAGYRESFGDERVKHVPIPDYAAVDEDQFWEEIYPFLTGAVEADETVVVHCSAGSGRTGHILVLWLAAGRSYDLEEAIEAVRATGRSPLEAATRSHLRAILDAAPDANSSY